MAQAVGMVEVFGLVAAFMAADAGCKAANVTLEPFDKNKPAKAETLRVPNIIMVKFRGSVTDVRAAVEAAIPAAEAVSGVVSHHVIPQPEDPGVDKMLKISCMDKKK